MKKYICCILLATLSALPSASAGTTKPTYSRNKLQQSSSAKQTAVYFLKQMEKILAIEHQKPKQTKIIESQLVDMISNQNLIEILNRVGLKMSDIPAKKIAKAKHSYLNAWIASINFYVGHILYDKIKLLRTTSAPSDLIYADMVIPVAKIANTHPIDIFVRCVKPKSKKAYWQVMLVMLVPRNIKKTTSRPSTTTHK